MILKAFSIPRRCSDYNVIYIILARHSGDDQECRVILAHGPSTILWSMRNEKLASYI